MAQKMLSSLRPGGSSNATSGGCGTCVGFSVGPQGAGVQVGAGATPTGIDRSITVLGCTYDANEVQTGRVTVQNTVNEDGTAGADIVYWWAVGSNAPIVYDQATHGTWGACAAEGGGGDEVRVTCLCDDVAGDGTNIVKYVAAHQVEVSGAGVLTSTALGTFTDNTLTTAYAPVNPVDCDAVGAAAVVRQGREIIENGTLWSPSALVQSYTIRVAAIGDPLNPPTFTDGFGNVTTFELGEVTTYGLEEGLIDTTAVVGTGIGDSIVITYTEISV